MNINNDQRWAVTVFLASAFFGVCGGAIGFRFGQEAGFRDGQKAAADGHWTHEYREQPATKAWTRR